MLLLMMMMTIGDTIDWPIGSAILHRRATEGVRNGEDRADRV